MRATTMLSALLFGVALAQAPNAPAPSAPAQSSQPPAVPAPPPYDSTTTQVISTTTRTVVRVLTATMTAPSNGTRATPTGARASATPTGARTASKPSQLIGNSASRGGADLSLAGLAGLALYAFL